MVTGSMPIFVHNVLYYMDLWLEANVEDYCWEEITKSNSFMLYSCYLELEPRELWNVTHCWVCVLNVWPTNALSSAVITVKTCLNQIFVEPTFVFWIDRCSVSTGYFTKKSSILGLYLLKFDLNRICFIHDLVWTGNTVYKTQVSVFLW